MISSERESLKGWLGGGEGREGEDGEGTLAPPGGEVEAVDGKAFLAGRFEEVDDGFLGFGIGGEGEA